MAMVVSSIITTVGFTALYLNQNKLIYPSWVNNSNKEVDRPTEFQYSELLPFFKEQYITTEDNVELQIYTFNKVNFKEKKTLVIFRPNAGNIGHSLPRINYMFHKYDLNIVIWSYRGYGLSGGYPSEIGIKKDCQTLYKYLVETGYLNGGNGYLESSSAEDNASVSLLGDDQSSYLLGDYKSSSINDNASSSLPSDDTDGFHLDADAGTKASGTGDSKRLILLGTSIGGAVAIHFAHEHSSQISALILENTFLSMAKVIPFVLPWFKYVVPFCHEKWASEDLIGQLNPDTSLLILNSMKDEVVPADHSVKLYELSNSNDKVIRRFKDGFHNDIMFQDGYWEIIDEFMAKLL